jgi:hypothetical protein
MTGRGQDWLKLLASRATPAGQLVDRVGLLGDLLDEIQKRLTGLDELERRVDELERRVDELSRPTRAARKGTAPRKPRSEAPRPQAND